MLKHAVADKLCTARHAGQAGNAWTWVTIRVILYPQMSFASLIRCLRRSLIEVLSRVRDGELASEATAFLPVTYCFNAEEPAELTVVCAGAQASIRMG